jgi:hypothetical protein
MATIDIKLTQAAWNAVSILDDTDSGNSLGNLSAMLADAAAGVQDDSDDVASYSFNGGTFRLNFPDGSFDEFTGVVLADPTALKGTATATGARLFIPGEGQSEQQGLYSFSYDLTGAVPTAQRISSLTNAISVKSLIPSSSPDYDQTLGNATLQARGAIAVSANGTLSGSISNLTIAADKLLTTASISGDFKLSGDVRSISEGDSELGVSGTLDSLDVIFADGSFAKSSGLGVGIDSSTVGASLALGTGAALSGDDTIRVELPATLAQAMTVSAGNGNDAITLAGGGGLLHADAGAGKDSITIVSGSHRIDGGAGIDTLVYQGPREAYTVTRTGAGLDIASTAGIDKISNVERVQFGKTGVAYDVDGSAGQAYRIYEAALGRPAEAAGLGYWIWRLENGLSLQQLAAEFTKQAEFAQLYGANPTDAQFLRQLYLNILGREPDAAGYEYWGGRIVGSSRAQIMVEFSEGFENQAQVIGAIQNGIDYTLWTA